MVARAADRPHARDLPGPARDAGLADGAQHRSRWSLLGVIIVSTTTSSTPAPSSSSLFSLAPLLLLVAVLLAPIVVRRNGYGRVARRGRGDPRGAGPGPQRASPSSATRAAARSPPRRSSAPGRSSSLACCALFAALGLDGTGRDRRRRGGPVRGQRHRGRPGDPVEHRRLPARDDQRPHHRLRRRRRRRARLRRHPAGGRDRDRRRPRAARPWSARASPGQDMRLRALGAAPVRLRPAGRPRRAISLKTAAARRPLSCADHPERPRDPDRTPPQPPISPESTHGATAGIDGGRSRHLPNHRDETSSPRSASASSSSTAAWARPWSSSTSTPEDYGGLEGKCHEALVLNRPDVIEGVHTSMLEAGAEVVETDTFQGSPPASSTSGASASTRSRSTRKAAEIARKAAGPRPLRRRLDRPDRLPAGLRRPDPGRHLLRRAGRGLRRAGARPGRGRRRPDHHRDRAGHPRGQGGDLRRPRGVQARPGGRCRSRPAVSLLPQGGKMLLGTDIQAVLTTLAALDVDVIGLNCSTGPEDMRDAIRYLGETQPAAGALHPQRRACPCRGPTARRSSPRSPEPLAAMLGEFVERHGVGIVGGCCGTTPEHIRGDRASASPAACPSARPAPGPPQVSLDDDRDAAGAGAARRRWSASGSTRRARARPRSCCSPTTTTASSRSPRTRSKAAPTCSTSASR